MQLKVNGEIKVISSNDKITSLSKVIKELGHHPKTVVVELNGSIVNPKLWEKEKVKQNDILEIVTIVGGGA